MNSIGKKNEKEVNLEIFIEAGGRGGEEGREEQGKEVFDDEGCTCPAFG